MKTIETLPAGFQAKFFTETESFVEPVIRREGARMIYPAFVRVETREDPETGEERTVYRYFEVPVEYDGKEVADETDFAYRNYAQIRKFFYGPQEMQSELRDDFIWEAHRQAVRSAFPKSADEVNELAVRFEAIKVMFWGAVDAACALVGKSRSDLPEHFNAEEMLAWAQENGMTAEAIATYSQTFSVISLNLLQNNRNWDEMFG